MTTKKFSPARFIHKGFSQDQIFRQFAFESLEEDQVPTQFRVRVDPTRARAYDIQIQDFPRRCQESLERRAVTEDARGWTFAEDECRRHLADRLAAKSVAHQQGAPPRQPFVENTESARRAALVFGRRGGMRGPLCP